MIKIKKKEKLEKKTTKKIKKLFVKKNNRRN